MAESILLTTARVTTFDGDRLLTGASGFFFERDTRLYFVTSRHVLIDKPSKHFPNRIEIELHTDAVNLTSASALSVWLYVDGKAVWRQGRDAAGDIDVAVVEIDRSALPTPTAGQVRTRQSPSIVPASSSRRRGVRWMPSASPSAGPLVTRVPSPPTTVGARDRATSSTTPKRDAHRLHTRCIVGNDSVTSGPNDPSQWRREL